MKRLFSVGTPMACRAEAQHRVQLLIKHCVAIVLLALALGGASEAAVDMTGDWYASIDLGSAFVLHIVQTGNSLQTIPPGLPASGTVDSATGAFDLLFAPNEVNPPCGMSFLGQVSMDGDTFTGTVELPGPSPGCNSPTCACDEIGHTVLFGSRTCGNSVVDPGEQCDLGSENGGPGGLYQNATFFCCTAMCQFAASGTLCGGVGTCNATGMCSCGNGVVDPGEECDDGSANRTGGTCCSADCQFVPAGTACTDDGDLCTADVCVGFFDRCAHWAVPSGGCATPTVPGGASIVLQTRHGHNRAHFKWGKGPAVALTDFGDPESELTRLCIYQQPGHSWLLVAGASPSVSAGGMWTQKSSGWKFRSKTGAPDGVTGVTLTAATKPLKAKVGVTIQGNPAFTLPWPQEPAMVVQFKTSLGTCWEATFLTASRSTATEFKAKSATPP